MSSSAANSATEAVEAAAAATNGATPHKEFKSPFPVAMASSVAYELGFGFISAAMAAGAATYSANRFLAAYRLIRR